MRILFVLLWSTFPWVRKRASDAPEKPGEKLKNIVSHGVSDAQW